MLYGNALSVENRMQLVEGDAGEFGDFAEVCNGVVPQGYIARGTGVW
jgi:hypothetical protein